MAPFRQTGERFIRCWLWLGIALVGLMMIMGGITRLTGSGLSIVDWRPITGALPPLTEPDWQTEFENYKKFPEYQQINSGMGLAGFKRIYFWEYAHRTVGRVLGITFIVPFFIFYAKGWLNRAQMKKLTVIFTLGVAQAFMGWYMVKSGLVNVPHVSHFRLAAHQALALLLVGAMVWTALSHPKQQRAIASSHARILLSVLALIVLIIQIQLGALVAGLKGGYFYSNFPFMGESFFPSPVLIKSQPLLNNGVALQFIHRWTGFIFLGIASWLFLYYRKPYSGSHFVLAAWCLTIVQVILGIFTLWLGVPVWIAVAHQFTAGLMLVMIIACIHKQLYS